jgi:hypothetical protein
MKLADIAHIERLGRDRRDIDEAIENVRTKASFGRQREFWLHIRFEYADGAMQEALRQAAVAELMRRRNAIDEKLIAMGIQIDDEAADWAEGGSDESD